MFEGRLAWVAGARTVSDTTRAIRFDSHLQGRLRIVLPMSGRLMATRGVCAVFVALALAAALAGGAGARSATVINLGLNQVVTISGTSIGCGTRASGGKPYIYCTSSRPTAAYVALMASNGRVEILSVKTHKAAFDRTPASARSSTPVAHLQDIVVVSGTSILCDVFKVSGKPTMVCEYVDSKGVVRPNSYSFGIGDSVLSSLRWDPAGKVHVLNTWRES